MPSTPSYVPSESDKTAYSSTEESGFKSSSGDPRRALSILPTIPHNRQYDASTALSRQTHRPLERTSSINLTGPRRVDAASRIPVDFRTLRCVQDTSGSGEEAELTRHLNSVEVTETTRLAVVNKGKKGAAADFAALDWHTLSVNETCGRLGVAPEIGLDKVCISITSRLRTLLCTSASLFAELLLIARHLPLAGHGRPPPRESAPSVAFSYPLYSADLVLSTARQERHHPGFKEPAEAHLLVLLWWLRLSPPLCSCHLFHRLEAARRTSPSGV
jgi:hypothetical protein